MKHGHFEISLYLRSLLGQYPRLFYPIYSLTPKNRKLSVSRHTDLVIEGFPRSANTFAVAAFKCAQNKELEIAHHMHVSAQVIRASKLNIPTIVLIREPKDAVISLVIRDPSVSLDHALKMYVIFHETILPYKSSFILAPFETVINNYSTVIERLNLKFNTSFIPTTPRGEELKTIFEKIDSFEEHSETRTSRPTASKKHLKSKLLLDLEHSRYQALFERCENIYNHLLSPM
ncbi:MAG: hypothetical protein ACFB5Z_01710 [Elainellaceae cyanobacterium]